MEKISQHNRSTAYLLLRLTLGINFFGHGLVRLPKVGMFRDWMVETFKDSLLPHFLVYAFGSVLPYLEFLIGLLLILGLFTRYALIAGALIIASLILGSCLLEKWEWAGGQMVYGIFYFLLIYCLEYNQISMDQKILKK